MSRRRKGGAHARTGEDLALDTAIIIAAAATGILILSTLLRIAWPGSAGAGTGASPARGVYAHGGTGELGGSDHHAVLGSGKVIRVQVLNGCGVGGAGAGMASLLRRSGRVDVLDIANADRFDYESTIVVDRTGNASTTRRVARMIGDPPIVLQRAPEERFDVTVIVGYDKGRWLVPAPAVR